MSSKLMTLEELSDYIKIRQEKIIDLVDQNVILAYKIGGELLRFRKEQIDAIRSEIEARVSDSDRITVSEVRSGVREKFRILQETDSASSINNKFADFFYFNDFYIISSVIIVALLVIILKGLV